MAPDQERLSSEPPPKMADAPEPVRIRRAVPVHSNGRVVSHVTVDADYIDAIFDQVEKETGRRPLHLRFEGRNLKPVVW